MENPVKKEMTQKQAFARLSAACARTEHSSGEMLQRMRRWQMDEEDSRQVLDALVEARFVDDARFARTYVDDKVRFNKWGPKKIEQGLLQKGVDRAVAREAVAAVGDDTFEQILAPLIQAKARTIKARSPYEHRYKLMAYAIGRGFTPQMAARSVGFDGND